MAHASGASARSVPARKGRDLRQRASTRVANCRRAGGDRHLSPDERRRHCLGRRRLPHSGEARIRGRPTARSGGELGHEERPGVVGGLRDPGRTICDTPPPGPSSHQTFARPTRASPLQYREDARLPHSGKARIRGRPTPRSGGELGQEEKWSRCRDGRWGTRGRDRSKEGPARRVGRPARAEVDRAGGAGVRRPGRVQAPRTAARERSFRGLAPRALRGAAPRPGSALSRHRKLGERGVGGGLPRRRGEPERELCPGYVPSTTGATWTSWSASTWSCTARRARSSG